MGRAGRAWGVAARRGLGARTRQAHRQRAGNAQRLAARQQRGIAVELRLRGTAGGAQRGGLDQHQRDRRVDQRGLDRRLSGRIEPGEAAARREQRPAAGERNSRRIGAAAKATRRAGSRLPRTPRRRAPAHGRGCACRCWPARCAPSHCRPGACDEATLYRERTHRGAEIAAVARPVDRRAAHRHLSEEVIDIAIGPRRGRHDHHLAGARGGATEPVDLLAVGSGLPIARSSSASRAAGSSGRSAASRNRPLLVPPRIQAAGFGFGTWAVRSC